MGARHNDFESLCFPGCAVRRKKGGRGGEGVCESFKPNPYVGRVDRGLVRDERTGGLAQGRDKTR